MRSRRAGWAGTVAETKERRGEKLWKARKAERPLPSGHRDNGSKSAPEPYTSTPRSRRAALLTGDASAPGTASPRDRALQGGATT